MEQSNRAPIHIEEAFRIIADHTPVLIWIAGIDKQCYFFNASWLKFTGRTIAQECSKGWAQDIHPDDIGRCLTIYNSSFEARKEFKIEYRRMHYQGQYRWLLDNGMPRYLPDGTFAGYIGYCVDINELLESEKIKSALVSSAALEKEQVLNEELAATNEELSAANEELSSTNEELRQTQDSLARFNVELEEKVARRTIALARSEAETQALNEELRATNEELSATNEDLQHSNDELYQSRENLQIAINELRNANQQIERSERLFKSIALNIPKSLIIIIGKDHRFITIEGDLMAKMGYDGKDYAGKHPTEVAPPERYEATRHLYDRVLSGEQFTMERKGSNGGDFLVNFVPLKNDQDEIYAGLIIAIDITEIKQGEEKSAKLAAIVDSSDDAIISKTLDGIVTSWNEAAERLFGYTADEMIGQPILKVIPDDRLEEEPRILTRIRNGERVKHFETQRMTKDGKIVDVSLTISPVKDVIGGIIGASKIVRDISEKKQDEQRKNDFIAMVSHELKTPLTSLTAIIQLLNQNLENSDDVFFTGAGERAYAQVKRMNNLINGFLDISRLESGKLHLEQKTFDIEKLLQESIDELRFLAPSYTVNFQSSGPIQVNADEDKISSVISNFLNNATKYSNPDQHIVVSCIAKDGQVIVSIKDEGIGMGAEDLAKIFDRFYRVESNNTRHIAGFGIGLYLSAEILKRHNGKTWAESERGKGSTFYFSLPHR